MFLSKPLGILALLDEQCSVPRATDLTFVTKLSQVLKKKKSDFFVPSKDTVSGHFSIVHFAGKVWSLPPPSLPPSQLGHFSCPGGV